MRPSSQATTELRRGVLSGQAVKRLCGMLFANYLSGSLSPLTVQLPLDGSVTLPVPFPLDGSVTLTVQLPLRFIFPLTVQLPLDGSVTITVQLPLPFTFPLTVQLPLRFSYPYGSLSH